MKGSLKSHSAGRLRLKSRKLSFLNIEELRGVKEIEVVTQSSETVVVKNNKTTKVKIIET